MSPVTNVILRGILALLFGGAGLWMVREAVFMTRRRSRWKREGALVEGEIVGFEQQSSTNPSDLRPYFSPVVTYLHRDGKVRRFTSGTSRRPNPWTAGQKVAVRYIGAGGPGDAEIDAEAASLTPVLALWTLAVVFLGCALLPIVMPMPGKK